MSRHIFRTPPGGEVNISRTVTILLAIILLGTLPALAASCESLSSLKLPDTTITLAQTIAAGGFTPPSTGTGQEIPSSMLKSLPAFCRVIAEVKPTQDSDIK